MTTEVDTQITDAKTAFIAAFRRHSAGVAIITGVNEDGTPAGFTASSLASLAAEPPLATFNIAQTASFWPNIRESAWVALHILGRQNLHIARRFSADRDQRFVGDHWFWGEHHLPILKDANAVLIGQIEHVVPIYSNATVAVKIDSGEFDESNEPLTYFNRQYHSLNVLPD